MPTEASALSGVPGGQTDAGPTTRQMLALWVPLAASIAMMILEPTIINIGLGRTTDPELALAAYGVAFSLALLIEAPIIMLLDASVARSAGREAFAVVRRFTVALGVAVTAIGLIVSFTPLYGLIVEGLMNIPPDVAARARPTLMILSLWPMPIAWRRAHQGVLVRTGRTAVITGATGVRLVSLAAALFTGLLLLPARGAVVAGLAMVFSVVIEAAVVTVATQPALRSHQFATDGANAGGPPLTKASLWRFYRPLVITTLLRQSTRPVLNAGIAAAALPRPSLAAWPVAWGFAVLITGPAWSLQQLSTALSSDQTAFRRVRRFSLGLSAFFSLILAVIAFSPLFGLVMGGVYNLPPELQALARPAVQILSFLPLVMGAGALYRGLLIRQGCTGIVRTAMAVHFVALVVTLVTGAAVLSLSGATLAAAATLAGVTAELIWFLLKARC